MGTGKTYSTQYLLDSNNNSGVAGQVLSTTSTGIDWADANTLPGAGLWLETGNNIYNSNSGNVGIGRSSSITARLFVEGPVDTSTISTSSTPAARINNGGAISNWIGSNGYNYGYIQSIQDDGSNNLKPLSLQPLGGNVGIGVTSPGYTLEIAGPSTTSFAYQRTGVSANKWGFHSDNDATYWQNLTTGNLLFTLQNAGNVGIGTTAPTSSVHVNGLQANSGSTSAHIPTGTMRLNFAGASSADEYGASLVFTQRWWTNSTGEVAMGQITGVKETGNGNYGGGLAFFTSNNTSNNLLERLRINELGNVGIGTASPDYKLEVESTSDADLVSIKSTAIANNTQMRLGISGNDSVISGTGGSSGNLVFKTYGSERMRIDSSGNVGIGTILPTNLLTINDPNANGSITDTIPSWWGLVIDRAYTTSSSAAIGVIGGTVATGSSGRLYLGNSDDVENSYIDGGANQLHFSVGGEKMRITNNGNVGIGTTNPINYKLEVNGNVKGDSFGTDESITARIFSPSGAAYNGSGTQTGYLIMELPDNGAFGVNNMMSGVIRVFDYTFGESFDVHFAGYWYSGYNWTNCTAFVINEPGVERNFNIRFGSGTGSAGANTRPYIAIGEATSTWTYCKFSVTEYTSGHSNANLYRWNSGWAASLSATLPGSALRTVANTQTNNWKRANNNLFSGNSGNVGIGTSTPDAKFNVTDGGTQVTISGTYLAHLQSESNCGLAITAGTSSNNYIAFGDINSYDEGIIAYNNSTRSFLFRTAGGALDDLVIDSVGNVGIGTTNPDTKLQVYGTSAVPSVSTTFQGGIFSIEGTSTVYLDMGTTGSPDYYAWMQAHDAGNGVNYKLAINPLGGNVGIGTASPGRKLEVDFTGSVYGAKFTRSDAAGSSLIEFANSAGVKSIIGYDAGVDGYKIGTASATNFVVKQSGNVGIGTTSPSSKLELGPNGSLGANITNKNVILNIDGGYGTTGTPSSGQYKVIGFTGTTKDVTDITGQTSGEVLKNFYAGIIGGDYFNVNRFSFWQGGSERLTIQGYGANAGNVGIGTTSPLGELMVRKDQAGSPTRIIVSNDGTVQSGTTARLSFYEGTSEKGYIERRKDGSGKIAFVTPADDNPFVWENPSGEIMRINNSKVGINDTTLQRKFNVYDATDAWIRLYCGSAADWIFGSNGSDHTFKWYNQSSNGGAGYKMALATSGTLTVSSDVVAYGSPSDKRLKENIKPIESALDKVSKLQGVTFDWKKSDSILKIKQDIGFIAQDVQKIIPELVRENEDGMLSMRHQGIAPILLEAIKELKAEIDELKKQIK